MKKYGSIFERYYANEIFIDRFLEKPEEGVTVIIPAIHTNELWRANLMSIYREVPVKELLIGDGGVVDDTNVIASEFPRVTIHNHRDFKSLGYSIRKLIESVKTDWFIYLHSDVFLPDGWYDGMKTHQNSYDWFGCRMRQTIMIEFDNDYDERPYAGSQMGRTAAFINGVQSIDDDYVYRQEDFVFSEIVRGGGFKEGKIDDLFHYHQMIKKESPVWSPYDVKVHISQSLSKEQEIRIHNTQFRGAVKYLNPTSPTIIRTAIEGAFGLISNGQISRRELLDWISATNPRWNLYVKRGLLKRQIYTVATSLKNKIRSLSQFI